MSKEFFIVAESFAAPFCSDRSTEFVVAESPEAALERFAAEYKHPCGLYSATVFESAEAFHKNRDALARWLCNHEIEKQRIAEGLPGYSYRGEGPGRFEMNGEMHEIANPKEGRVVAVCAG